MPEGPEVKVLVNYLQDNFLNKKLLLVELLSGKYIKNKSSATRIDNIQEFNNNLPANIIYIDCRGKFIYWIFDNKWVMFMTLGMSGRIVKQELKNNRLKFHMHREKPFYFCDTRNFGTINFYNNVNKLYKKIDTLGIDFFNNTNTKIFNFIKNKLKKIKNKKKKICEVLLNQKIFAGVGNYIRADALYLAKINPFLEIGKINDFQLMNLIKKIIKILNASYKSQYCEYKYVNSYKYEELVPAYEFKVYSREYTNKNEKVLNKKINGRTIWYVNKY